jgi:hypothetical protein
MGGMIIYSPVKSFTMKKVLLTSHLPYCAFLLFVFVLPSFLAAQGKNQIAVRDKKGTGVPGIEVMIFDPAKPLCKCEDRKCVPAPVLVAKTEKSGIAKFPKNPSGLMPNKGYTATINMVCKTPENGCEAQLQQPCGWNAPNMIPFQTDKKGDFKGFDIPK